MEDDDCSASQHSENREHLEMEQLDDKIAVKGVDDEARSSESATSSRDEEESKEDLKDRLSELQSTVTFLSHQMTLIMNALHVQPCACETCGARGANGHHNGEVSGLGMDYAQRVGGGKIPLIDRRAVSDYALQHGGMAAVRRFGVPAPVSSYYQRKDSHGKLVGGNSPGPSTDGERNGEEVCDSGNYSSALPSSMDAMLKMSSVTGTPGFLRGRGRGRPKLIGDELDADLVEYMVQLHKNDNNLHRMSATQALEIARVYILEKAPGLLEEQGGHVKLKLTWAMKLVNRIVERQREIELGLPAGTLQNMGRNQQLAEIVAMSKFGGFPSSGVNGGSMDALQQLQGERGEAASATPEITNVRELDLSHFGAPLDSSSL
ncbi:hypothetical protein PFISCL1PPCAC_10275, partial [Pristionchus fissidentatus]